MKNMVIAATAALGLIAAAPAVHASPVINFQVAGAPASSVDASITDSLCLGCSVHTTLDSNLGSQSFSLSQGQSDTFNFFKIKVDGLGSADVDVTADLAFTLPADLTVVGSGSGGYFTIFGVVSGGHLTWDEPAPVTLSDGSVFDVDLSNISAFGLGNSAEVTATVTACDVATPEPASLALLGTGLLGAALLRFRKRQVR